MRRRRRRRRSNILYMVLTASLALILCLLILHSEYTDRRRSAELQSRIDEYQEEQDERFLEERVFECEESALDNVVGGMESIIFDSKSFFDICSYNDIRKEEIFFHCNIEANTESYYILRIVARAESACAKIQISINNFDIIASYPVYTEKCEIDVPIPMGTNVETIRFSLESECNQKIYLSSMNLVDSGCALSNDLRSGVYLCDASQTAYSESDNIGTQSKASVVSGSFLYSVFSGVLSVYDISDNDPQLISELDGIGNAVDIVSINDGNALAVGSRANGAYFIDISDPYAPEIASHYDTLELATGISAHGNYVFICSRYFGIEIVDLTDLKNPVFVSQIDSNAKEYYCSDYYNGYLYISAWGQREIDVYDLCNYSSPRLVTTLEVDGNPGDITVQKDCLFVATGYHSADDASTPESPGFGTGNGMEIYNLAEPSNPEWISSSKIDGRYKYSGNDFWKIKVSGDYAVLASTYNGAYIYDVTNPYAPERLDHIVVNIDPESDSYKQLNGENYVFSWDTESFFHEAIISVAIGDGKIFFGGPETGLYKYDLDGLNREENAVHDSDSLLNISFTTYTPELKDYEVELFTYSDSIYSAKYFNGMFYVGTSSGILILNENMEVIDTYITSGEVKDLIVSSDGSYIYTAESDAGIGIYENADSNLIERGRCKLDVYDFSATSLALSSDEQTIIAQTGFSNFASVNISDKTNPLISSIKAQYSMYYRNLGSNLLGGSDIVGYDNGKYYIFPSGNEDQIIEIENSFSKERDGMAVYGDKIIAITGRGYVYFNPMGAQEEIDFSEVIRIPDVTLHGKVNIDEENAIMVVSDCFANTVYIVDIADIDTPTLVCQFNVSGNPDVASFSGDTILIPLRHGGLLKLSR